ncbi:MAG: hypothetical protein BRD54_00115 [Bacteroidetes bacterium SW_8_64_56]|jgi:ElaB/YqjD/DUF883 family membrane-anchored ribosome-binding protein|nr:MAG: hypothetical protein BRD54_00115 [Bacteroidetes bacterium SW_8_64_56]
MSKDPSTNNDPSTSVSHSNELTGEESLEELQELLGELRAEVTRLKARQAKLQAKNWVQRHPAQAVVLSGLLGGAAGYGIAVATRTRPPTLSEQAQRRLRGLAEEARQAASDVGRDLSDRAARSGQQARQRAQKTGRHLAEQAEEQGEEVRKGARELLRRAAERAQRVGTEAGDTLRQATEETSKEVRELGETLAQEAEEVVEEQAESVTETLSAEDESSGLRHSILTAAGLAAGGYLAAKLSGWL